MRRQNTYLLLLSLFLLLLPMFDDEGVRLGVFAYFDSINRFVTVIFDPRFATDPVQVKFLAGLFVVQFSGWVIFAMSLAAISLYGLIRNKGILKYALIISCIVLVHGVLEVTLALSLTTLSFTEAVYSRFGVDFSDFMDDYDALLNSTLVPIGLIAWYLISKGQSRRGKKTEVADVSASPTI